MVTTVSAPASTVSIPSTRTVPLKEAADALGVGVTTARRWVRSGRLKGYQVRSREGTVWLVELPVGATTATTATAAAGAAGDGHPADTVVSAAAPRLETVASAETAETIRLARAEEAVTRLEAHVTDLRQTVTRLEQELDARRHEGQVLLTLLSRMPAAPALVDGPSISPVEGHAEGSTETAETTDGVEATETAETTPAQGVWWRRLGRWLAGP